MQSLLNKIDFNNIPRHVAIIMDGNGRWAEKRGMLRTLGHKNANISIRETINASKYLKIPYITLYVFSSENWKRPKKEIYNLLKFLFENIKIELIKLQNNDIRLIVIGEITKFSENIQSELNNLINLTKYNKTITLILAINYSAKNEIIMATKSIAKKVNKGITKLDEINKIFFEKHLYTKNIPDVDLMIRTSGEQRISNFLLWQSAYAELYFTKVLWPDFRKKDFYKAIINYQKRERRFGKIKC